jgi:F0F1-type ATP synthase beta subunit
MEGVITAIHGDVVEIEFNRGFPDINYSLIVKKPAGADLILEVHYLRGIYEWNGVSVSRRFTDDKVR